jgi:hypothetical protein
MAEASTISGSSSMAMNPAPPFCADDDPPEPEAVDDADPVDTAEFVALLAMLPALADVVAALLELPLSGSPPANAFCALIATAPTTSDFNSWRIDCAPLKLYKLHDVAP